MGVITIFQDPRAGAMGMEVEQTRGFGWCGGQDENRPGRAEAGPKATLGPCVAYLFSSGGPATPSLPAENSWEFRVSDTYDTPT